MHTQERLAGAENGTELVAGGYESKLSELQIKGELKKQINTNMINFS